MRGDGWFTGPGVRLGCLAGVAVGPKKQQLNKTTLRRIDNGPRRRPAKRPPQEHEPPADDRRLHGPAELRVRVDAGRPAARRRRARVALERGYVQRRPRRVRREDDEVRVRADGDGAFPGREAE